MHDAVTACHDAAREAIEAGLCVIPPAEDGSKRPLPNDSGKWDAYKSFRPTEKELGSWYPGRTGLGVVTGIVSRRVECWDFDDRDTYQSFLASANKCDLGEIVDRIEAGYCDDTPGGGVRWLVRYPSEIERTPTNIKLARRPKRPDERLHENDKVKTLIELPAFSIVAPTNGRVHPSGKPYTRRAGSFSTIASYTLDERQALIGLARSFDAMPRNERHSSGSADSYRPGDDFIRRTTWAELLKPRGWAEVFTRAGTTYWRRPGKKIGISATTNHVGSDLLYVFSTSTEFVAEKSYSRFGAYAELEHGGDLMAAARALGEQGYGDERRFNEAAHKAEVGSWDDPDSSLLDDRRGELPKFPMEAFDPAWQAWLSRAAKGAGVTPDHVAVPLLAVASSLIGAARRTRASRSWSEPLTLWTAVIGFSGSGKTPGLDVSRRALSSIESNRKGSVDELRRAHERLSAEAKAALKKWKLDVASAVERGRPAPPKPPAAEDPGAFISPRFYVSDATIERLAVLLQARRRGMLMICDELAGLFSNMRRYSNGSDREFWLEAWNGGHYVVERLGRPPTVIDHLLIGMTGGFQPDKFVRSLAGDDDGMYARILFGWPSEPGYTPLSNDINEIEPAFQEGLRRLLDLSAGEGDQLVPRYLDLSPDAVKAFDQFRQLLHAEKPALDGREREWWAKGGSHVLRLAGTLAYLDWAMRGNEPLTYANKDDRPFEKLLRNAEEPTRVEAEVLARAVDLWRTYFWPHARAALRLVGLSDRHKDARRVLKWLRCNSKTQVSREDVRRDALGRTLDANRTQDVIDSLAKAGWLRKITIQTGGRAAHRWDVNPKILQAPGAAE
jgi:hypothetical protein